MVSQGCDLEAGTGTFERRVCETLQPGAPIRLDTYRISMDSMLPIVATVTLRNAGQPHTASATGHGPFDAFA